MNKSDLGGKPQAVCATNEPAPTDGFIVEIVEEMFEAEGSHRL